MTQIFIILYFARYVTCKANKRSKTTEGKIMVIYIISKLNEMFIF
jgi:hypothetical protein